MATPAIGKEVAIFSTQFITTLTAVAYSFSELHNVAEIKVIAIKHHSFARHFELISNHLVPCVQSRGIRCQLVYADDLSIDSYEPDILITPRIDHRHSAAFIERVKPPTIIETGESIGVEPKLYSLKTRHFREKSLKKFRKRPYVREVVHAYVITLSGCHLSRLQSCLDICSELQPAFRKSNSGQFMTQQGHDSHSFILLLPYLTDTKDKMFLRKVSHRLRRKLTKKLGLEKTRHDRLYRHVLLRQSATFLKQRLKLIPNSEGASVWVKPHPKNQETSEQIIRTLMLMTGESCRWSAHIVPANIPLEEVILSCDGALHGSDLSIIGYGTNLLAAMMFLYPEFEHVAMIKRSNSKLVRLLGDLVDALFHRTEFLRRRHVSRLIKSLDSGLTRLRNTAKSVSRMGSERS